MREPEDPASGEHPPNESLKTSVNGAETNSASNPSGLTPSDGRTAQSTGDAVVVRDQDTAGPPAPELRKPDAAGSTTEVPPSSEVFNMKEPEDPASSEQPPNESLKTSVNGAQVEPADTRSESGSTLADRRKSRSAGEAPEIRDYDAARPPALQPEGSHRQQGPQVDGLTTDKYEDIFVAGGVTTMSRGAVFYDIENLLQGYGVSAKSLSDLSLRDILDSVTATGRVSDISVQRAYANWSDSRLGVMRGEINELGIEPIQVFGFSRFTTKNAADIQLAIDAIDLALARPFIDVFVIVSGDGGFASVAKKLHEYGKTVIGCAYRGSTNRVFQANCDEFVALPDPPDSDGGPLAMSDRPASAKVSAGKSGIVDYMRDNVDQLRSFSRDDAIVKTREILEWMRNDTSCKKSLDGHGIPLSTVVEAIRYFIPDWEPWRVWFAKSREFLQHVCTDTTLQVVQGTKAEDIRLATRGDHRNGLPDLNDDDIHSLANYRSLIGNRIRLPEQMEDFHMVGTWVTRQKPINLDLGSVLDRVNNDLGDYLRHPDSVKNWLLCFISADIFDRSPLDKPLSDQTLTLKSEFESTGNITDALRLFVRERLTDIFGDSLRVKTINEMIP